MLAGQAITMAAALNDVGSWALISFQATFYTRVYELTPDVYAPALATILPIGGIVGGVGGGLLADWLSKIGGRGWLTAGARRSRDWPLSATGHGSHAHLLMSCRGKCLNAEAWLDATLSAGATGLLQVYKCYFSKSLLVKGWLLQPCTSDSTYHMWHTLDTLCRKLLELAENVLAGATIAATPALVYNVLAPEYQQSLAALLVVRASWLVR